MSLTAAKEMVGAIGFEPTTLWSQTRKLAERIFRKTP